MRALIAASASQTSTTGPSVPPVKGANNNAKPALLAARRSSAGSAHAQPAAIAGAAAVLDATKRPVLLEASSSSAPSPIILPTSERAYSLHARGREIIEGMGGWAEENLLPLLKDVKESWQPADYLPVAGTPAFIDQVLELQARSAELPDEYLVALVGDMITEEALPTYMSSLNRTQGIADVTGASPTAWARWTRGWTAEENRHGDLLNKYLYLGGRVDMRAVEATIHNLISSGIDTQTENNPYLIFIYTSFQERATKISHGATARLAAAHGDATLQSICAMIAADEARHEAAYSKIVAELFHRDPEGALLAFADMMRKGITMPAHLMDDGRHGELNPRRNLFSDYSAVAERIGVYTAHDYAKIVEHLIRRWQVLDLQGLSAEGLEAQEFLGGLPQRIRRLADLSQLRREASARRGKARNIQFTWVNERAVSL